jgi:hypothetical protein
MMTLNGKKTYVTAVAAALASFALAMGWLSPEQYQVILGLLGSLGLAALRSGVARCEPDKAREGEPAAQVANQGDEAVTVVGMAKLAG